MVVRKKKKKIVINALVIIFYTYFLYRISNINTWTRVLIVVLLVASFTKEVDYSDNKSLHVHYKNVYT